VHYHGHGKQNIKMDKPAKILVIDDDPDIGNMFRIILEYNGYTVYVLENTEQAKQIIQNDGIDFIIMDMLLSGINGTDICAEFKKDISISHIPLVMMSAHPDAKKICLQAGADDFISKPFDIDDLLTKISNLIQKNRV
jgi:DNA-binding response OmpR family regulator